MQPYLGAPMHIAIVKEDLTNFIHTHAIVSDKMPMIGHSMMDMGHIDVPAHFGPRLMAQLIFPEKGLYQIFGEFKHNGKVIVTNFMAEVE